MQLPPRPGQQVDWPCRQHPRHRFERAAHRLEPPGIQIWRINVDEGRVDLDRDDVQPFAGQNGEDFRGDADPVTEREFKAHCGVSISIRRIQMTTPTEMICPAMAWVGAPGLV